jgi:hypothetical protein
MSAKTPDENGIQPEFNFYNQSKDASADIENNSSIADQACFGEIGFKVVEILPLCLPDFVMPCLERFFSCAIFF